MACAVAAAALGGCDLQGGTPYVWHLPKGFPPPAVPEDNLLTVEKVDLGRKLFYDTRLSANGRQACASCHRQSLAFTDGARTATGSTGQRHHRNSMALANSAYNSNYTWAHPGITTLEQHMLLPLFGDAPVELGAAGHEQEILERLSADAEYRELFARAFPFGFERVNFEHIVKALASFVRTLVSFGAPFDRYAYGGEDAALSESQIRGMNLFMSERLECAHCHAGINFSQFVSHETLAVQDRTFHATGLYNVAAAQPANFDFGLYGVTGDAVDKDKFKAPSLRNIERTAPYMHDGSIATLAEVLDFYAAGGREIAEGPWRGDGRRHPHKSPFIRGFALTEAEKADVVNFLHSLTDEAFLADRRFADPSEAGAAVREDRKE